MSAGPPAARAWGHGGPVAAEIEAYAQELSWILVETIRHAAIPLGELRLVMGATMAAIMLGFMLRMHANPRANTAIFLGSAVVFAGALWLVRSQATVDDVSYMKAMIPHHSIAILTSQRARITDPRVRKLADTIIESQRREISEMKALITDLEARR